MKKILKTLCLILPVCLSAQQLAVHTYYNSNAKAVTVINALTGDTIQSHTNLLNNKLWHSSANGLYPCSVIPTIAVDTVFNGYDITYTFSNPSSSNDTSAIGIFYISGFRFDSLLYLRNFSPDATEVQINHKNKAYWGGGNGYPQSRKYSPVSVFGDEVYTVGISLKYPLLDYKHETFMRVQSPGKPDSNYIATPRKIWELFLQNNETRIEQNSGDTLMRYYFSGNILPGEIRIYKISVRFNYRNDYCHPWITTLQPYKKYFNEKYGQITYQREADPIFRLLTAQSDDLSSENPYGFRSGNRIDTLGFGPTARTLIAKEDSGYKKMMIWTPTGMYLNNRHNNYPFKFTSHWLEGDTTKFPDSYGHKMEDALDSLPMVAQDDRQLGLWWGRAGQVMTDWDQDDAEILNPDSNSHVVKALAELDLAIEAGATLIGLDAFTSIMPVWSAYDWLQEMREYAPDIKFSCEQGSADLLNTKAAFYYYGDILHTEHYLANYFLGENEIWAQNKENGSAENFYEECSRLSELGYVLVNNSSFNLAEPYFAKETWYQTKPYPDLGPNIILGVGDTIVLNASYYNHDTFTWYKMGLAGVLGTDSVLSISTIGTYYVLTTNIYGCGFSDTVVVTISSSEKMLSADDFSKAKQSLSVSIFPNPGGGEITIKNETGSNIKSVTLMDAQGKELFYKKVLGDKGFYIINVSDYFSGIYLIQVETNDGTFTKKKIMLE